MPALTAERPDLEEAMASLGATPWPEFLNHDAVVQGLWHHLYDLAADYQFVLLDESGEAVHRSRQLHPDPLERGGGQPPRSRRRRCARGWRGVPA